MDLASAHAKLRSYGKAASAPSRRPSGCSTKEPRRTREDLLATCLQRGERLLVDREPDRARPLLEEACSIWRKVEPSRPSDRVGSLAGLSWVYRKQGLAGEARRVLEEADEADRRLRKQAAELRDHAEYLKALPLLQESVEIAHILHPDNQIDLAARLIDLGDLLDVLGKYRSSRAQTERRWASSARSARAATARPYAASCCWSNCIIRWPNTNSRRNIMARH